ncbi:NADH-cytochrome b5 reductase [Clydaea vesicula]|uniref:NADH-cytochrome b5 reductase 1 n=1 Tax=Clydaea vesicula TaxID=447962 RepID=A0AAD5U0H5_9FUNG|nr:NADH-cytochrome b5 reductase [Clydaea vesicula]
MTNEQIEINEYNISEIESLEELNNKENYWAYVTTKEGVDIYRADDIISSRYLFKGQKALNQPIQDVLNCCSEVDFRVFFDKHVIERRMLEKIDHKSKIFYSRFKLPFPFTDRSFVIQETKEQRFKKTNSNLSFVEKNNFLVKKNDIYPNETEKKVSSKYNDKNDSSEKSEIQSEKDIEYWIVFNKTVKNDNVIYGRTDTVRAEILKGGWILEKLDDNLTKVTYILQVSPGGYVPNWLTNMYLIEESLIISEIDKFLKERREDLISFTDCNISCTLHLRPKCDHLNPNSSRVKASLLPPNLPEKSFAGAAVALIVANPYIKTTFPELPSYVPGVALGVTFTLYYLKRTLDQSAKPSLHKTEFKNFKLINKKQISPNSAVYRFALPTPTSVLGLPIGQHISIGAFYNGKDHLRSYTPISSDDDKGYFELLIKTYATGNVSKYINEISVGDSIKVKGPKGNFVYSPNLCKSIGMIAGGTGITPMLQIAKAIKKNPDDKTKVSLIFANVNESDILLKDELDVLCNDKRFSVYYVLNNPPPNWKSGIGFVTKDMVEKYLPKYSEDSKILLCGPPPMIKAMQAITEELGFPKANAISKLSDAVFKF